MMGVTGLVADVLGFLLIAWEWHRTFKHTYEIRQLQLQDAYERNQARHEGRQPENRMQAEEETMAKEFSKLHGREGQFKQNLFLTGMALVILGFLLQVIGALRPSTAAMIGFISCP
jgi:Flp pilus assembly protein TadB